MRLRQIGRPPNRRAGPPRRRAESPWRVVRGSHEHYRHATNVAAEGRARLLHTRAHPEMSRPSGLLLSTRFLGSREMTTADATGRDRGATLSAFCRASRRRRAETSVGDLDRAARAQRRARLGIDRISVARGEAQNGVQGARASLDAFVRGPRSRRGGASASREDNSPALAFVKPPPATDLASRSSPPQVAVIYYSRNGRLVTLANIIAEGIRQVRRAPPRPTPFPRVAIPRSISDTLAPVLKFRWKAQT